MSNAIVKNESMEFLKKCGIVVKAGEPLVMKAVDGKQAGTLVLADKDNQLSANVIQSSVKLGHALDSVMCVELAKLKRNGAHKDTGYDGFGQFGEALTGYSRTTVNQFANVGDTCFTADGKPMKPFVSKVSVSALNQLSGLLKDSVYVYRARVDFDFIEAIFKHYDYALTVANINELIKILKRGDIPSDLVTINKPTDGKGKTYFTLCESDIVLEGYTEVKQDGKQDGKQEANKQEVSVYEMVSDAITALGKQGMNDDLKARYDAMYAAILSLSADIKAFNTKPEDK